jgi:hypothetical protein
VADAHAYVKDSTMRFPHHLWRISTRRHDWLDGTETAAIGLVS